MGGNRPAAAEKTYNESLAAFQETDGWSVLTTGCREFSRPFVTAGTTITSTTSKLTPSGNTSTYLMEKYAAEQEIPIANCQVYYVLPLV